MPVTPRAAIYCRLSQDRTGAGVVVERQERECRALADQLGWDVVRVEVDNDLSAYSGKARPGYLRLLELVQAGEVDAVLAWHTDRLHRSPRELEDYIAACERHGVVTHTVRAGPVDLTTPSGRAVARTLGAWARHESEHLSARTLAGKRDAAARGGYNGGPRPFGYELVPAANRTDDGAPLRVVPAEAEAVQQAAATILEGSSLRSAARTLNEQGVVTVTGTPFTGSALRKVLLRPTTAGLRSMRGEIVGRGGWEPLLPEETWRAVCAVLNDPARRTTVSYERRWLLSGLVLCGVCGTPLTANTTAGGGPGNRHAAYRCRAAPDGRGAHVTRDAKALNEYVTRLALARLAQPDAAAAFPADDRQDAAPLHLEAEGLQARLDEAARLWAEGTLTTAQLSTTTARLRELLADVEQRLAATVRVDAFAGLLGAVDLDDAWQAMPLARQRTVIDTLMAVTVLPRNRRGRLPGGTYFDPEAVRIAWRS